MKRSLRDAVVLVTGAGAGVGAAEVALLRKRGALVCAVDIDENSAKATGADLAYGVDVTDREAMAATVPKVVAELGRIDVVLCNAGIAHAPTTLRRLGPTAHRVIEVNLIGALNTIQPALDHLIASKGHAVLVSSVGALLPAGGGVAYSVSKIGVEMLGRGLRLELAPFDVGVTITYFGPVDTAMARTTLDTPKGALVEKLVPRALRNRISAEQAAEAVLAAVEAGRGRVIVPARWRLADMVRSLGTSIDPLLARSPRLQEAVRAFDDDDDV